MLLDCQLFCWLVTLAHIGVTENQALPSAAVSATSAFSAAILCCVLQVECEVGAPQVNYRESISRPNDVRYVHKKQSGGSGQFADVAIKFEPGEPGTGFVFRSEIKGGAGESLCSR